LGGSGGAIISASEEDLAILLDNLIENALRYSPSRVVVGWGRDGDQAWLAGLDEGAGMAPWAGAATATSPGSRCSTRGPDWLPARRPPCSSASLEAAPAATAPAPGSASRSCRRSRAAGAGVLRSPTVRKVG